MEAEGRRDVASQLRELVRGLRESAWLILGCVLVAVVAGLVYASLRTPVYESTAKLLLQRDDISSSVLGTGGPAVDPGREAATDVELATVPAVAARVAQRLDLRESPSALASKASASVDESNVISLSVTDRAPRRARALADAFALEYVAFRRDTDRRRFTSALELVQARISEEEALGGEPDQTLQGLRAQARQLELLASLQTGDAQVIQEAQLPTDPAGPGRLRVATLALLFGGLLGGALALLRHVLDRRVKTVEEAQALLPAVPLIGLVPTHGHRRTDRRALVEAFYTLETNVSFLRERSRSILITSAATADGKSTVTLNLALAMARHGHSVLVVDADLRRPTLSRLLNTVTPAGVSTVLVGQPFSDALSELRVEASMNGSSVPTALQGSLPFVPAGPLPADPQALLRADRVEGLLASAGAHGETVLIDGPPLGTLSDMLPVARRVGGVIVCVRLFRSRRDDIARLLQQLRTAGLAPMGLVVVGVEAKGESYGGDSDGTGPQ